MNWAHAATGLGCLILTACSSLSGPKVKTLGQVTALRSPGDGNWLLAATPRLLRFEPSAMPAVDLPLAIAHYDALASSALDTRSRIEAQRRAAYLRIRIAETQAGDEAQATLTQAIKALEMLLQEHASDPNQDLTRYQLARAYQNQGDVERASANLRALKQPDLAPELHNDVTFRLAELDFQRGQFAQAAAHYRAVMDSAPDGPFYPMAQYKLGWSEYRKGAPNAALDVFGQMLEQRLPEDVQNAALETFETLLSSQDPWLSDALRVSALSLAALGGVSAFSEHFGASSEEPDHAPLLYLALAQLFQSKNMVSSSASTYAGFAQRHPLHRLAPQFEQRQIGLFLEGGFAEDAVRSMGQFAQRYAPQAGFWQQHAVDVSVMQQVRDYLATLSRHFHALSQASTDAAPSHRTQARQWYQKALAWFPDDPGRSESHFLLAELLQIDRQFADAADHFMQAAYDAPGYARASEAAYAAVLTYQALSERSSGAQDASEKAIQAGLKLTDHFPDHPQWQAVIIRVSEQLVDKQDWSRAAEQAERALGRLQDRTDLQRTAWSVLADARFAMGAYEAAENAYAELLSLTADETDSDVIERLALSIYRQAEAARSAQSLTEAAEHFLRIGQRAPQASIRMEADLDAAAAYIGAKQQKLAEPVLERMLLRQPKHPLATEAQRKLAAVYEGNGKLLAAASSYTALSHSAALDMPLRQAAAWRAAELYDSAKAGPLALSAYADYARRFAEPLDQALKARQRLAVLSRDQQGDLIAYAGFLQELVNAEQTAGQGRTTRTRLQAAQAALELGRLEAARASGMTIGGALERSLLARQAQMQRAIGWLRQAADADYAEVTPAALFAIGVCYGNFAHALLHADAPAGLSELEIEELSFMLEEQAYPFEELAIEMHERNLAYLQDGLWNVWIDRSAQALAELVPAQYAKREQLVQRYDPFL